MQSMKLSSFFNEFRHSLVEQVKKQITPIYNGEEDNNQNYHQSLQELKRTPFKVQENAVQALMKLLVSENQRAGILNGDMGTGKTMMGICAAYLLHREGYKRTLILCPPHLVYKWKREIENTLPDVDVVILNGSGSISALNKIRQNLNCYNKRPTFFIVGRVRLRMGGNWKPAFMQRKLALIQNEDDDDDYFQDYQSSVLCCSDCGVPIPVVKQKKKVSDDKYYFNDKLLPNSRLSCNACKSSLWQSGKKEVDDESNYTKLLKALCKLPTIGKVKAKKILSTFNESLLINSLEDNLYQLVNLIGEDGQFVFTDTQAKRLERAISKSDVSLSESHFQVSEFIKRYFPRNYFGLLMCDEAHEYKNGDAAQGQAMGVVASQCSKVLLLTGTLMGGYADDIFHLLLRSTPKTMIDDGFGYAENGSTNASVRGFLETYGILKYTYPDEKNTDSFKTAKGNKSKESVSRAPGLSVKAVSRYLLPYTVFVRLEDIDPDALVPYTEHSPILIDMENDLYNEYHLLSSRLTNALRKALGKGDRSLLGSVLSSLLAYSETAFEAIEVLHPHTGDEIGSASAVIPDNLPSMKEQAMIDLCLKNKAEGRKVLVYSTLTKTRDTQERLKKLLTYAGLKTEVLRSSVKTDKREDWILDRVDRGIDVLVTNPKVVETGLDLLDFPTIVYMQTGYNVYCMMQSMRRSWRIGQTKPVDIHFICYKGTAQEACLSLMAQKVKVSQSTSGEMPNSGLEALNQNADNMEMAIAKKLIKHESFDDLDELNDTLEINL